MIIIYDFIRGYVVIIGVFDLFSIYRVCCKDSKISTKNMRGKEPGALFVVAKRVMESKTSLKMVCFS